MPYKFETKGKRIKLPREADRRVKLTDAERADIRERYKAGEGVRSIARAYEGQCSRRMIQFVLFPERMAINAQHYKDREQHKTTYARVKGAEWAAIMREHRNYKHKILEHD